MLKKLALATAAVGLLMSTASADYYIVQEKATKKCKVVETRQLKRPGSRLVRRRSRPKPMRKSRSRRSV